MIPRVLTKWAIWPVLLIVTVLLSLKLGVTGAVWADVWHSFGASPEGQAGVIATYRLPRVAASVIVGMHFALAGLIMQIVLRNPLADPTIFGISGGASLAVVAAMAMTLAFHPVTESMTVVRSYIPIGMVPHIALAGGIAATAMVLWLSWDNGFSVGRMTLNGVILGAILNAIVMALVLSLSESRTELAVLWLAGSLYARGFDHLWPTLPWTAIGLIALLSQLRALSALRFDRQTAQSMGLRVAWAEPLLILIAAGLAASAVAVAGPVGFVGLLVPHVARLLGARSLPYQVWIAIFGGALLVMAGDTLGRIMVPPREVPVGIVTSLIGAPVFAYILNRRIRSRS